MKNKNYKISIIVPFYKVEKFARKCIESIISQTYKNLEIILVDDGSPDKCGDICDEYAKKDNRIKVIHQVNKGLCSARNAGLSIATGDYIGFVDSDDWISSNMYEFLLNGILKHKADISICGYYRVIDNSVVKEYKADKEYSLNGKEAVIDMMTKSSIKTFFWNKLFKREIFDSIKFPDGIYYEGTYMMHGLLSSVNKVIVLPGAKYYYYYFSESVTKIKSIDNQLHYVNNLIKRYNDLSGDYSELIRRMKKEIVRECANLLQIYYKNKSKIKDFENQTKNIGEFLINNNIMGKSRKFNLELKYYQTLKKKDLFIGYYVIKIDRYILNKKKSKR